LSLWESRLGPLASGKGLFHFTALLDRKAGVDHGLVSIRYGSGFQSHGLGLPFGTRHEAVEFLHQLESHALAPSNMPLPEGLRVEMKTGPLRLSVFREAVRGAGRGVRR